MTTQIPLDDFSDYPTASIVGRGSIRWPAFLEASDASLDEARKKNKELRAAAAKPDWRAIYVIGFRN